MALVCKLVIGLLALPMFAIAADVPRLDAVVEREHAAGRFDGVVLVGQGDAIVHQRAIGLADRETKRPHRIDGVWRWASVSKQVTAVLTMQLVQQGKLSLDETLATLLPSFQAPRAADISLRQLLQHTSGLPNPDTRVDFYTRRFDDEDGPLAQALGFCSGPPAGEPGTRFAYNNCDTLVLQAVLERVAGLPYAQLVQTALAQPLGLRQLGVTPVRARIPEPQTPRGYIDSRTLEPTLNLASFGAGGALRGTPHELWQFDRALMQGRLLDPVFLNTLWQGDPKLGYVALGAWSFPARLAGCSKPVALVERRGQIGGIQVRNLLAPEFGAALIVFSNTAETVFGEIWQGQGLTYEMASAAFCTSGERSGPADVPRSIPTS